MTSYGLSLLSGGLDSTTVTVFARTKVEHLTALTFHYGQTHSKEVDCARGIAQQLGVEHRLLDISFFGTVAWYSALTDPDRFPVPTNRSVEQIGFGIPITYVPLRNTFFLALAGALLESRVLYAIEVEHADPADLQARVFLAPNAIDYSGYPDCRPEYFTQVQETLNHGSKLWTVYGVPLKVETPILEMTKAQIVSLAMGLGAPLEQTWSCYQGGDAPCGDCDSCVLRARGFSEAGYQDPLLTPGGRE